MTRLQFIPPKSKNSIDIQFSNSYKRKLKAYENNYLKILEPEGDEKRQMKHWAYRSLAKPEHVKTTLLRVWKTKLKGGEFEDQDSNIITGPKAPLVGFHYMLHEVIENPKSLENGNSPWSFPLSSDTFEVGRYKRPKFHLTTNERGDIVKSTVAGGFDCWYLAFDEKEVRKILEMEREPNFSMGVVGYDHVPRSVHNEQEWLEGSVDDLVNANKGVGLGHGETYLTKEYGGLNRYLKNKEKKLAEGQKQTETPATKKRQYRKPEEDADAQSPS